MANRDLHEELGGFLAAHSAISRSRTATILRTSIRTCGQRLGRVCFRHSLLQESLYPFWRQYAESSRRVHVQVVRTSAPKKQSKIKNGVVDSLLSDLQVFVRTVRR